LRSTWPDLFDDLVDNIIKKWFSSYLSWCIADIFQILKR
jgi:hypothetical protein